MVKGRKVRHGKDQEINEVEGRIMRSFNLVGDPFQTELGAGGQQRGKPSPGAAGISLHPVDVPGNKPVGSITSALRRCDPQNTSSLKGFYISVCKNAITATVDVNPSLRRTTNSTFSLLLSAEDESKGAYDEKKENKENRFQFKSAYWP